MLDVPVLVMGRVITRIFGVCSGAVPSACHSEQALISAAFRSAWHVSRVATRDAGGNDCPTHPRFDRNLRIDSEEELRAEPREGARYYATSTVAIMPASS